MGDLIPSREAADLLGITVQALHALRNRGRLAAVRLGRGLAFRKSAVLELRDSPAYQANTRRRIALSELALRGQAALDGTED